MEVLTLASFLRGPLGACCMLMEHCLPFCEFWGWNEVVRCVQEYERRFLVWLDNMEYAHAHNQKQSSFKVGPQLVSKYHIAPGNFAACLLPLISTAHSSAE